MSERQRHSHGWLWATLGVSLALLVVAMLFARTASRRSLEAGEAAAAEADRAAVVAGITFAEGPWRQYELEALRPDVPDGVAERVLAFTTIPIPEQIGDLLKTLRAEPSRRLSAESLSAIDAALEPGRAALDALVAARDRPAGRFPLALRDDPLGTPAPHLDAVRGAQTLLSLEAAALASRGRSGECQARLEALARLPETLAGEPLELSKFVELLERFEACEAVLRAIAVDGDAAVPLPAWQARFLEWAEDPVSRSGLIARRAALDRAYSALAAGALAPDTLGPSDRPLAARHAAFLRFSTGLVRRARSPVELLGYVEALPDSPGEADAAAWLMAVGSARALGRVDVRVGRGCRAAAALLAAERFRRQRKRWPRNLAELVPAFLPAVPEGVDYAVSGGRAEASWTGGPGEESLNLSLSLPPPWERGRPAQ